ncbi:hypothetical protein CHUAL_003601 [Chamberlinius hualienensis]
MNLANPARDSFIKLAMNHHLNSYVRRGTKMRFPTADKIRKFYNEMLKKIEHLDELRQVLKVTKLKLLSLQKKERELQYLLGREVLLPCRVRVNVFKHILETRVKEAHANLEPVIDTHSNEICVSRTCFSSLQRIRFCDLRLEMSNKGYYVICRVIEPSSGILGYTMVIEDENGDVILLHLFNYPKAELPIVGQELIIKEPYFKMTTREFPSIRCDCPSDIFVIRRSHFSWVYAEDFNILWKNELREKDLLYISQFSYENLSSFRQWYEAGLRFFEKKRYIAAMDCFHTCCTEFEDTGIRWRFAMKKMADVCFKLKYYELAITCCEFILDEIEESPDSIYSLQLKCDFMLQNYFKCSFTAENLKRIRPLNEGEESIYEISKECSLPEDIYVSEYENKIVLNSNKRQNVRAYFSRDLAIADNVAGKGRGIIAKKSIEKNSTLIIKQAICSRIFLDRQHSLVDFDYFDIDVERVSGAIIKDITLLVYRNPIMYSPLVFQLDSGGERRTNISSFYCNYNESEEMVIDVEAIKNICHRNNFMLTCMYRRNYWNPIGIALFGEPSLLNHSCEPNAAVTFYDDTAIVRATQPINAGEEVTIDYTEPHSISKEKKNDFLLNRNFICRCTFCLAAS